MQIDYIFMMIGIIVVVVIMHIIISKGFKKTYEGLTNAEQSTTSTQSINGIATNSSSYVTSIANQVTTLHDKLLISKYKSDYEKIVISLEELINLQMVNLVLTMNPQDPDGIRTLNQLHQTSQSLNSVMKIIDSN
jgi:hypothetical protein